jgi:L-threonylcarbamoyladenylate synthase
VDEIDPSIKEGVDLVLDGGELPGTPSTVVDLTRFEDGRFDVVRDGAVPSSRVEAVLRSLR